jgi:ribosome biogenesis GTPase
MNTRQNLVDLGWSDWFEQRAPAEPARTFARVAAVDRAQLTLWGGNGPFRAKLAGGFLHRHRLAHEWPCAGDWVVLEKSPGGEYGLVHAVLERRTALRRRAAGSVCGQQMIAANVDGVVIVQSCHFDFNVNRLERYLVMARQGGVEPCILLTKQDLVDKAVLASQVAAIGALGISTPVVTLSNVTGEGFDGLKRLLLPGKTYCFVGSSGVGKSTLINQLMGRPLLETGGVSGTGEGRHTTVRRELMRLEGGALVIDNPGMRELGILAGQADVENGFSVIAACARMCRYRDCSHTTEPGCAVVAAVESGEVGQEHYENFLKLRKEAAFHQMSDVERRKKDRAFGRLVKAAGKRLWEES